MAVYLFMLTYTVITAICSDWHSTGFTCPWCNWTMSQRTIHMEPSATSTMVTGPVREHLQAGIEEAPIFDCPAPLDVFMIMVPNINIQTYLLTYLLTTQQACAFDMSATQPILE